MALADYINQPKPSIPLPPLPPIPMQTSNHVSPMPPKPRPDPIPLMLMNSGTEYQDRYEFSPGDSELSIKLFQWADTVAGERFAGMLQYIRNTGAVLVPNDRYGYIIKPVIGTQGWMSMEEYERERQPLIQYGEALIRLLKILREESKR